MTPWDEAAPNKTQLDLVLQRKKKGNCWRCPHVICIDWYLMCFQQLWKLTQYVKLGTSQLSLFQEQGNGLFVGTRISFYEESLYFFVIQTFKHLRVMSQVCVYVFIYMMSLPELCKGICSAQASCIIPYSIFFWPHELCILPQFEGRCLSLYLLTHSATGSFWKSAHGSRQPDRSGVKINDPQPNV